MKLFKAEKLTLSLTKKKSHETVDKRIAIVACWKVATPPITHWLSAA